MNLRSLLHLADMRAAADAQSEIRDMTEEVLRLTEEQCPITMGYFNENLKGRKYRLSP
jgi:thymidylate synthase (FAD)